MFDKEGFVRAGLALINYEDSFLSPTAVELLQYAASLQMNDLRVECAAYRTIICELILNWESLEIRNM